MSQERTTAAGPIRLTVRSVEQVLVEPDDEDRFMMTAKEATRACAQVRNEREIRDQFVEVILYLSDWCRTHPDVQAGYAYPGDGFLNIIICTKGEGYRHDLDDEVTRLDIGLFKRFKWLKAELMQVPASVAERNASLEKAILLYGDGIGPHQAG